MTKTTKFLIGLYIVSSVGVWIIFSRNTAMSTILSDELSTVKSELAGTKALLDSEKVAREVLENKISTARTNVAFLALALCPTLEATDKNASCIKNSTEWLSQTIQSGTLLTSPDAKAKMDSLLLALGKNTKPTAKQLYELLKPIEISSLQALTESLK